MTLVSPAQALPGEEITAAKINTPVNQLTSVLNGGINDDNISGLSGTKITPATLPASAFVASANIETRFDEMLPDIVVSGCVWSGTTGLDGSMTSGVIYVSGKRVAVSSINSRTFTASKDTYVSVSSGGTVSYSEVSNNAAVPTVPADSIWIARIVTSGTTVTTADNYSGWQPYTPTWTAATTNPSVGNGTIFGYYSRVGKTYKTRILITIGSTTSAGSGSYSLTTPVAMVSPSDSIAISTIMPLGNAILNDATNTGIPGFVRQLTTTTVGIGAFTTFSGTNPVYVNATGTTWSSSVPFTLATGDKIALYFEFEAA